MLSGEVVEGGRWRRELHGYMSLPVMVRSNSVIAVGANDERPDYSYADNVTLHVFELTDGATARTEIPGTQGGRVLNVTISRDGSAIHTLIQGESKSWRLLLRGIKNVQSVDHGSAEIVPEGSMVTPKPGASEMTIHLSEAS